MSPNRLRRGPRPATDAAGKVTRISTKPPTRSFPVRLARGLAWAFAGLFLLVVVLWLYAVLTFTPRLQERLTDLQQRGEPITITEARPAPVSPQRNAAPEYLSLFEVNFTGGQQPRGMAGLTEPEVEQVAEFREHPTPAGLAQVRPLLARSSVRQAFATLQSASEKPNCVFPIRWEDGPSARFPHLSRFRTAERLLLAQALVCAAEGQRDDAATWLLVGLRMARHTLQEPTLIAQLVGYTLYGLVADTLPAVLAYGDLPRATSARLQAELAAPKLGEPLRQALLTERVFGLNVFQEAARDPGQLVSASGVGTGAALAPALHLLSRSLFARLFWQWQQLRYLDHMDRLIPQVLAKTRDHPRLERPRLQPWDLSALLLPAFGKGGRLREQAEARLGLMRLALTLSDYRAAHKAYPPALSHLPSPLPQDPFSGQDFVYRHTDSGYVLYSLGANLKDDGGQAADKKADRLESGDLVWGK